MRKISPAVLAVLATAMGASALSARAAVMSTTLSFSPGQLGDTFENPIDFPTDVPLPTDSYGITFYANFASFDPSLGTLEQVDVTWVMNMNIHLYGDGGSDSGTASMGGPIRTGDFSFGGMGNGFGGFVTPGQSVDAPFTVATVTYGPDGPTITPLSITPDMSDAFGAFIGTGLTEVDFDAGVNMSAGRGVQTSLIVTDPSYITVSYTYAPVAVPEPTSAAVPAALAAPALLARRRRR